MSSDDKSSTVTTEKARNILLEDCLIEVRSGVGDQWKRYRVLGATRDGLAPAKEGVGKKPGNYKLVEPGTILYNPMRINIGSIAMLEYDGEPGITSPDYVVFKCRDGILHPRWFYHWLRSPYGETFIKSLARGAVRERMLFNRLVKGTIVIPSWGAQCRCAEKLAAVEQARFIAEEQIRLARLLPNAFVQEILNEIGIYSRVRLGTKVTKIGSGMTPTGGYASYQRSGIPLIRSQNVHMNRFDYDGLAFISEQQDAEMDGSRVQPGDVLLNITGASIGRTCVVPSDLCPANVNQHVSIIRSDGFFIPEYLSFYISTPVFQSFIIGSQAGATRQALTKTMIEDFLIPAPPEKVQKDIAQRLGEKIRATYALLEILESQCTTISATPTSLLRSSLNE